MEDIFSTVMECSLEDLVDEIRRLYLWSLRNVLVSSNLCVDDLVKLSRVVLPLLGGIGSGSNSSSGSGNKSLAEVLRVVG